MSERGRWAFRLGRLLPRKVRDRLYRPSLEDLLADRDPATRRFPVVPVAGLFLECAARGGSQRLSELLRGRSSGGGPPTQRNGGAGEGSGLDSLLQDVRFALRGVRRRPGFAAVVVTVLALGIGGNALLFSVLNSVVLRPLPFPDPEQLVFVTESTLVDGQRVDASLTAAGFLDWRNGNESFDHLAGYYAAQFNLVGDTGAERTRGLWVSSDFFEALRVPAALGRTFGGDPASWDRREVVLGHGLWLRRFGGSEDAVGSELRISDDRYQVVGVMPADFVFLDNDVELYVAADREVPPLPVQVSGDYHDNRDMGFFEAVGRLRPDNSVEQARQDLEAIQAGIAERFPDAQGDRGVVVRSLREFVVGEVGEPLQALLLAVGAVLLVAAINVAGLLLARAAARTDELAVRAALGASRARLVRQMVAESLTLAAIGGVVGTLAAYAAVGPAGRLLAGALPRAWEVSLDGRAIVFAAALSAVVGLVCGALPGWHAARGPVARRLGSRRTVAGAAGGGRTRNMLVMVEVAVSLVLVLAAGTTVRGFARLTDATLGFEPDGLYVAGLVLPEDRYALDEEIVRFNDRLLTRLAVLPGVEHAGVGLAVPFSGAAARVGILVEGQPLDERTQQQRAILQTTSPGYFDAMGIPLLRGRAFQESDTADSEPVAIVNEELVRRYYEAGADPLVVGVHLGDEEPIRVVGVVGSIRHRGYGTDPEPELYVPYSQVPFRFAAYMIRSSLDVGALAAPFRALVTEVDPLQPAGELRPMTWYLRQSVADRRLSLWVLVAFATNALLLSALGIFGVLSHAVAQRLGEIGIRMALGADRTSVLVMVARQGLVLAAGGLAVGLLGGWWLQRWAATWLEATDPLDLPTVLVAVGALAAAALAASVLPGLRAIRVDPASTLRAG